MRVNIEFIQAAGISQKVNASGSLVWDRAVDMSRARKGISQAIGGNICLICGGAADIRFAPITSRQDTRYEGKIMAYHELIKNFNKIREYMKQFYVYGFNSRSGYGAKSARSYDNERRRIESWLGDYMSFRQEESGKVSFLSVDTREIRQNPLYNAFKAKSFTANDIMLHFYLLDILASASEGMGAGEITEAIWNQYLSSFEDAEPMDVSTVRKKLKEYERLGIFKSVRKGNRVLYTISEDVEIGCGMKDALCFFSEADPLGIAGSFILDKLPHTDQDFFRFKHHYILHAFENDVLYSLLEAICQKKKARLRLMARKAGAGYSVDILPLKIYISTQNGRRYVLGYEYARSRCNLFRLDHIETAALQDAEPEWDMYERRAAEFAKHLWGVSFSRDMHIEHLEMTLRIEPWETYILGRLKREGRQGVIEKLDDTHYRYAIDVYSTEEMLPWLRSFTGRITSLSCSNEAVTRRFYEDLETMMEMYRDGGAQDVIS